MKRTSCLPSLFCALLFFFSNPESFVSAQGSAVGTVQTALLDYMMKNRASAPPPGGSSSFSSSSPSSSNTQQQQQQTSNSASTNPGSAGSNPFDLYNQLMQSPPQQSNPTFTSSSISTSTGGGSSGPAYLDILNTIAAGSPPQQTQPQAQPVSPFSGGPSSSSSFSDLMNASSPMSGGLRAGSSSAGASNPSTLYSKIMQMSRSSSQGGGHPPLKMPYFDPFPTTPAPITLKPTPKIIPFVPPEWNLTNTHGYHQSSWGPGYHQATNVWGHHAMPPARTGWEHHRPRPVQQPRPLPPPRHPMSQMTMMPRVRAMINKQAVQFGDLAYYQAHGCIDPTPTRPGPGGIRPTQTLWYGCQSRVSQMVCMRVAKRAGGKFSMMPMMMSMMSPAMTRTLEKCISPRMMTSMMFSGFSGGMGGMNPMAMMAMNAGGGGGGGGGGMAGMMPMLMMMMNRQNQAAAAGGRRGGAASNSMPSSFGPPAGKQTYGDPGRANTLISQAARIPPGAAQPQPQSSGSSMMNNLGSMFGMGGAQTPASGMPSRASSSSGQPDCSSLMPLMMSRVMAAGEGMNSPEAAEAIAEMRKQYLPYSCQEMRLKYTGLPLRLCCPGRVDPPTVFDLFKAKNPGGA